LKKAILVVSTRPTLSRERARWIPGIECILMFLHRNVNVMAIDPRDNQNEFERRIHVITMERMDVWRKSTIRSKTT
jgi:hypothetical protein